MRDTTERPEGVEAGTLKLVGTDEEIIYQNSSKMKKNIIGWQKRVIHMEMGMLVRGLRIYWRMGSMRLGSL